jgi:hypothetical protein
VGEDHYARHVREVIEQVLRLQPDFKAKESPAMTERGRLVKRELAGRLKGELPALAVGAAARLGSLAVEARDGTGLFSEIPWARVYSPDRSPSATDGWYVVYLFSGFGERAYLCLMQGTSDWRNSAFKTRPLPELRARSAWARQALADTLAGRGDLVERIELTARGNKLAPGYEAGTVVAFAYERGSVPDDDVLKKDLGFLLAALAELYPVLDRALDVPGQAAPEIAEAVDAADRAAGRGAGRGRGTHLTAAERSAVERRAMDVACAHLVGEGYTVKDVGAVGPYDVDARRAGERLYVEVKGTTSAGAEVLLTKGEVELHREQYPNNALFVVKNIALDRVRVPPAASGGELHVVRPWRVEDEHLTPISYRCRVPDQT